MTRTAAEVDVRPMTDADRGAVLELLTLSMAGGPTGERTADFFEWKHRRGVFGASPGLVATHEGHVVGVRLFMRWSLAGSAGPLRAVRAVDTATHPDFLRRGIFTRLTLELLDRLERADEVDLVFNTPNADSRPGYLRMGWQEVGLVPIHVSPVRPLRFLRGLGAARKANASGSAQSVAASTSVAPATSSLPRAGEAFIDEQALRDLVSGTRAEPRLHTPLSVEYLRWRYLEAPGLDYRCVPVHQGGRLTALGFGRVRSRAGLTELTLGDTLVADGDRAAARRLLRSARRSGVDHVTVHSPVGTEVNDVLLRSGYPKVPRGGIRLLANPRRNTSAAVLSPEAWRLSLGDLEVF